MNTLLHDLRFAFRKLRKSPGFTAVAVITLALGLTVNATIFFMINDWFLRPLPAADPGKLVMITQKIPQSQILLQGSYPDFLDFQRSAEGGSHDFPEMAKAYSGIMAYLESAVQMSRQGEAAERTYVHAVSGNYFAVLGAQPMMGRLFLPNEGRALGADAIVVLTYDCWRSRFASDPRIVGQTVKIDGLPFTVVGVTQPKFVGAAWGTALSGFVPISMLPLMNPGGNEVITNRGYMAALYMEATPIDREWKKGSAELLILSLLEALPRHGYEISKLIDQRSHGALRFHAASLYPLLYRLEKRGWIQGRWVEKPGQRRRRFYRLTAQGKSVLASQRQGWQAFVQAINRITGVENA